MTRAAADLASRGHKQISGPAELQAHVQHLFTVTAGEEPKPPPLTNSQVFVFTLFGFLNNLQILGIFLGIYAAANVPVLGMCFPAECSTHNINGIVGQNEKTFFISFNCR